jgi:purine-cytosine permease-like protein
MKLSGRELKLIEELDLYRKQKIQGLLAVVVVVIAYWGLRYAGVLGRVEVPIDSLLILYVVFLASDAFSNVRRESRYVDLLRRYVNNDAETIEALSERR